MHKRIITGMKFWLLLEEINKASLKEMYHSGMQSWWNNYYSICLPTIWTMTLDLDTIYDCAVVFVGQVTGSLAFSSLKGWEYIHWGPCLPRLCERDTMHREVEPKPRKEFWTVWRSGKSEPGRRDMQSMWEKGAAESSLKADTQEL